jgi:hypothetical protein
MSETDGWIKANRYIPKDSRSKQPHSESVLNKNEDSLTVEESEAVNLFIEKLFSLSDDSLKINHLKQCGYETHSKVLKDSDLFTSTTELISYFGMSTSLIITQAL